MRLKDIWVEKSNIFAYLPVCDFCAREEKINKKMKIPTMEMCQIIMSPQTGSGAYVFTCANQFVGA